MRSAGSCEANNEIPARFRSGSAVNFGLEGILPMTLYAALWAVILASIFWKPVVGVYYLVLLIPAQTLRDRLEGFPLGSNLVILVLVGIAMGLVRRRMPVFPKTLWTKPLWIYIGFTFLSLCLGSLYLGRTFPFAFDDRRFQDWRNYVTMLALLFLVASAVTSTKEMKVVIALMCLSVLALDRSTWSTIRDRDYSSFSEDLRDEGAMGYAGANGLAAFQAQIAAFLFVMAGGATRWRRIAILGIAAFSALCLVYSLSRGAYVAFLVAWIFLGLIRYRVLLVLLVIFALCWTALVPTAVQQRVDMTYQEDSQEVDQSSQTRLTLWEDAMSLFSSNPITGTGLNTYAYLDRVGAYRDTHNIYVKVLVETGVIGFALFLWLMWTSFRAGWLLFRRTTERFHKALGLGLAVSIVSMAAANMFGDRWTYLQVNGYLWVLAGLVARGLTLEAQRVADSDSALNAHAEADPGPPRIAVTV
jgi:putative inorganic carbon (HCO3(-)) transporter